MQKKDLKIGDLVFFEGRFRNGKVGHVGIVKEMSSDGEFRFLHASTNNGVIISRSTEPYYASRYLRGGRIIRESDAPQTAKKNIPKASEAAHKNQKRNNAFVATQAKKQIGVEAPKTKTEMEIESTLAQTSELVTAKNDTLVVHSRPASMRLESQPGKQEEEKERLSIGDLAMTRLGTTSVPKPIETTIDGDNALVHEVAPGETLYSISRKYNCTVEQIRQWNSQIGRVLKSGDKLRIFH